MKCLMLHCRLYCFCAKFVQCTALILFLLCSLAASYGYSDPVGSAQEKATFILNAMRGERAKLKSGICFVNFKEGYKGLVPSPQSNKMAKGIVTLGENGSCRIEWTDLSSFKSDTLKKGGSAASSVSNKRTGYYIRNQTQTAHWREGGNTLNIYPPDRDPPSWIVYFDLKAIGFYSWVELRQRYSWDDLIEAFLKKTIYKVEETSNNLVAMTWQLGSENIEWIIEVDMSKGFTPIHALMRQRKNNNDPWRTVQEFNTQWKEISGVWVPIHYEGFETQDPRIHTATIDMEFSWEKINEPVSESLFSYKSLNVPNEVAILNYTLGIPVVIKGLGQPSPSNTSPTPDLHAHTRRQESAGQPSPSNTSPTPQRSNKLRALMIAFTGLFIIIIAGLMLKKRIAARE